jgi:hypothetical protein
MCPVMIFIFDTNQAQNYRVPTVLVMVRLSCRLQPSHFRGYSLLSHPYTVTLPSSSLHCSNCWALLIFKFRRLFERHNESEQDNFLLVETKIFAKNHMAEEKLHHAAPHTVQYWGDVLVRQDLCAVRTHDFRENFRPYPTPYTQWT